MSSDRRSPRPGDVPGAESWRFFLEEGMPTIERAARRLAGEPERVRTLVVGVLARLRASWPETLLRYRAGGGRVAFRAWLAVEACRIGLATMGEERGERLAGCPDPLAIAALAEGGRAASRDEGEHVARCSRCSACLAAARGELAAGPRRPPRPQPLQRTMVRYAAAASLVAVSALLLLEPPAGRSHELAAIARVEPLDAPRGRGVAGDEAERRFRAGLDDYSACRFGDAVTELEAALAAAPGRADVALHLGSALLHAGRPADAARVLRAALPRSDGALAPEILWQLAQAALLVNDPRWAREILLELEVSESPRRAAARELLRHGALSDR